MSEWSRQYVKLAEVDDFADPAVAACIRDIVAVDEQPPIERKHWEYAMLGLFLDEAGRLTESTRVLAVGAGTEAPLFWLTNHVGEVVATDVYGTGKFSGLEARESMLDDPSVFAPAPYRADRLQVQWADARDLPFPDASFDVVYSLSSIEHFGAPADIAASAREMGRVLRPGGHAVVVTECFVRKHPLDTAPVDLLVRLATLGRKRTEATLRRRVRLGEVFTPRELQRRIVEPSGMRLLQPLDTTLSASTWSNVTTIRPGGVRTTSSGQPHPHVLLRISRSLYTSVSLVLEKPA